MDTNKAEMSSHRARHVFDAAEKCHLGKAEAFQQRWMLLNF
jgi:hypothetical protein